MTAMYPAHREAIVVMRDGSTLSVRPVRPGDALHLEGEVVELVPSRTKPQGIVRVKWTAYNQNGEAVYTFNPIGIVPRRPG